MLGRFPVSCKVALFGSLDSNEKQNESRIYIKVEIFIIWTMRNQKVEVAEVCSVWELQNLVKGKKTKAGFLIRDNKSSYWGSALACIIFLNLIDFSFFLFLRFSAIKWSQTQIFVKYVYWVKPMLLLPIKHNNIYFSQLQLKPSQWISMAVVKKRE